MGSLNLWSYVYISGVYVILRPFEPNTQIYGSQILKPFQSRKILNMYHIMIVMWSLLGISVALPICNEFATTKVVISEF